MKTCPVCGLELEDSYLFCPDDGSSLAPLASDSTTHISTQIEPASVPELHQDEQAGAVVLYCPMCAAEYPLTFSTCPVHGVELTKHSIPRSFRATIVREAEKQPKADLHVLTRRESKHVTPLTSLNLERPPIEAERRIPVATPLKRTIENDRSVTESDERRIHVADDFFECKQDRCHRCVEGCCQSAGRANWNKVPRTLRR